MITSLKTEKAYKDIMNDRKKTSSTVMGLHSLPHSWAQKAKQSRLSGNDRVHPPRIEPEKS